MSIPNTLLLDVVLIEALALGLAWLAILVHGMRSIVERAHEPRIATARDEVVKGLIAQDFDVMDGDVLERLTRRERVRLFNRVAPNLRGRERDWLGELAEQLGLVAYGRKRVRSRFWWRRLRGARLLTLAGRSGDAVLQLADDPSPLVRSQVAEWCGANPSERAVNTLIGMLGDRSQASRFTVRDALVRIGNDAIEPLIEALHRIPVPENEGGAEPHAAVDALAVAHGLGDARLAPAALRLADHPSARVREMAFRALGTAGGHESTDRLEEALGDPDTGARAAAAQALGELGHWQAGPRLVDALRDESWDVRAAAGRALVRIGPPGELLLRRALGARDPFAADMARHALDTAGVVTRFGGR